MRLENLKVAVAGVISRLCSGYITSNRRRKKNYSASTSVLTGSRLAVSFEKPKTKKYLAKANAVLKDVATLMLETGMRPEEVYRITVANIAIDQAHLYIPFGKTKAARRRIP